MAVGDVALNIVLKAQDETSGALNSVTGNLGKMEKATTAAKVAFGLLTGAAAGALVGALSDAARRGAEEEASQIRLKTALENTAGGYDASALAIGAAQKVGHDYGFTTTEINDSLALLTEQTGSADEAMKRIAVSENLARGAHVDLYTASKALGKATDENANTLGRMGIVLEHGADVTTTLAAVQAKFGGQAVEYGNSVSGSIDKTTVAIDDWTAGIGNSLGPAQKYIALLPGIASGVGNVGLVVGGVTPLLKDHTDALKGLGATAAKGGAVLISLALVVEAIDQVGQTVTLVTDNWNTFTFALREGKLSNIPVFGFFFDKANAVIHALETVQGLWDAVSGAFGGGHTTPPPPPAPLFAKSWLNGIPQAAGGDYLVSQPTMFLAGEAGPERATFSPIGRGGGGGAPVVNITVQGSLIGAGIDDLADRIGRVWTQARRNQGIDTSPRGRLSAG